MTECSLFSLTMSNLFTVSKSWHDAVWLYEALGFASPGDTILLIEDGVLACHSELSLASFVAKCIAADINVCALESDIEMRGVTNKYEDITPVNYAQFVELVIQNDKHIAW